MGRAVLIVFGIFVLLIVMGQINKALRPTPTLIHHPAEARATIAAPTATSTPLSSPTTALEPTTTARPTATIVATPVVSPTPLGLPETIHEVYIVQKGDTLNAIAARFSIDDGHNVTVDAIVAANGIQDPARIEVGEQFFIPVVIANGYYAPTPVPTTGNTVDVADTQVSMSVTEGCIGVAILKGALEDENMDVLETFGEGAAIAMVSTDDEILNMVGGIIALHMVDYGQDPTAQGFQKIIDGLNAYIETCEKLMGR